MSDSFGADLMLPCNCDYSPPKIIVPSGKHQHKCSPMWMQQHLNQPEQANSLDPQRALGLRCKQWKTDSFQWINELNYCRRTQLVPRQNPIVHFSFCNASSQSSQRVIHHFSLTIRLKVNRARELQFRSKFLPQSKPKAVRDFLSRSEVIDTGRRTSSLKKSFETWWAVVVFRHGMECAILKNRSTTTNITSLSRCVVGNPNTKFIEMLSQGALDIGRCMYKPMLFAVPCTFGKHGIFAQILQHPSSIVASSIAPQGLRWSCLFPHGHFDCWSASSATTCLAKSFAECTICHPLNKYPS